MANDGDSTRVHNSFRQLSATASSLNQASDRLGTHVSELESALKDLNLGVEAWVRVEKEIDDHGNFTSRSVGYAKLSKGWCIALRSVDGNDNGPEYSETEVWPFSEGPRWFRIKAVDQLPALLDELNAKAQELSKHLNAKLAETTQLVMGVKSATKAGSK